MYSKLFGQFSIGNSPRPKAEDAPSRVDWYGYTNEDVQWFEDRGYKLTKVNAEPGYVIIWDSRTMHYAKLPESDTIRTTFYVTYTTRKLATPQDLALKAELFRKYEGSTHWPHCNIRGQGKDVSNSKICYRERDEPLEKPELTDTLLKLAGIRAY
ncbi:hypothetical protein SCUP234_00043 [Seiridium cupressi]